MNEVHGIPQKMLKYQDNT